MEPSGYVDFISIFLLFLRPKLLFYVLTYYHNLELIFEDVFYVSAYFNGWHSDTKNPVIEIPESSLIQKLKLKLDIEQGYQFFIIHTEDYNNDIYIAAKNLTYKTDTVYYYERGELKGNERIADFVKTKKRLTEL